MDTSDLAKRMKEYEKAGQRYLTRRTPILLRLDGSHFHTFTKNFKRPFDDLLIKTMQETAKFLCENIMGATIAYTESDEITVLLVDYKKITSQAWFDNRQNKIESIAASMCTMAFNKFFAKNVKEFIYNNGENYEVNSKEYKLCETYKKAVKRGAYFDCRAFNIPKEEVTNNFYWRQLDASRNSIQMVGQANFSHKELQNKSCNDIQDMLMTQKGINWNDLPTYQKRGSCCVRNKIVIESDGVKATVQLRDAFKSENEWIIDTDIPIFKGEGREYIDKLVFVGEE